MSYKRSRKAFEADLTAKESPFVTYGTPLPALDDKARDDGSYLPVWKQEVTDERGRKRLHGAFTGGFSAGYFNTVGSKEGWTPANFVSSRANRYKDSKNAQQQRPEDFMDDEDIAEAEEARTLETKSIYAAFGSTADDERRQGFLMDLFRPQIETIGTKLLRRMGWRDGQGIGARVRRKASSGTGSQEVPNSTENELSAPLNTALITFDRKNDRRGLGYMAEAQLEASSSEKRETDASNMSKSERNRVRSPNPNTEEHGARKGGFGVGVINSMESDEDDDPFTFGPKIHYNRVIGGDKKSKLKSKEKKNGVNAANPLLRNKPIFVSKKPAQAEFRKCHDGRLPLSGFLLGLSSGMESIQIDESKRPMPKIPNDWKSQKSSVGSIRSSDRVSTVDIAKQSTLDPKSRAALLGEAQLPGKSVFDFLSPAARDRIAAASGRDNLPAALGHSIPSDRETESVKQVSDLDAIPFIDKAVAIAALGRGIGGWMPYSEDEAKRGRYQAFLRYRGELTEMQPERSKNLSKEDWSRELEEFAHAAKVFKPMTGAIASRFTTSSIGPGSGSKESDADSTMLLRNVVQKAEDPAEAAAKINMFGPLTRSVHQFYPTRLVCKRFNVKPPPHVQLDADASAKAEANPPSREDKYPSKIDDLVSQSTMEQLVREAQIATSNKEQETQVGTHLEGKPNIESKLQIDASRNDALEGARAGESVFKAIFGSDDEDD